MVVPGKHCRHIWKSCWGHSAGIRAAFLTLSLAQSYHECNVHFTARTVCCVCDRCHPAIAAVPNRVFYDGQLLDGCTEAARGPLVTGLGPVTCLDIQGREVYGAASRSASNPPEAEAIVQVPGVTWLVVHRHQIASDMITCCVGWMWPQHVLDFSASCFSTYSSRPSTLCMRSMPQRFPGSLPISHPNPTVNLLDLLTELHACRWSITSVPWASKPARSG